MKDTIKYVEETKSPRIIKTHLPLSMLPPNLLDVSKVVFVARNVKDVCVSFFHMEQMNGGGLPKDTSFDDYVKFFMSGRPGVYGNYWNHLKVICESIERCHYPFNLKIPNIIGKFNCIL